MPRKNLIVITSDEMRGDAPGYMGNPDCRTPHLDAFADRAVALREHFVCHGKCVPSRVSLITGRYPHTDGFRTITQHLPNDRPNWISTLRAAGYETAFFGHPHIVEDFWGDNDPAKSFTHYHSFTRGFFSDLLAREWPVPSAPAQGREPVPLSDGDEVSYLGRKTEPLSGFCDDNRTEQAIAYLTQQRDRAKPFFLQLNISAPHPKYRVEEPYYSMYDREAIQAYPHELPRNAPLPLRKMREIRTGLDLDPVIPKEIQAVYYGMITKVDALIGRLLATIDDEDLWKDTAVLFWCDHGDFAGQYGLYEKWDTAMQDCLLHVPCILYDPDLPQGLAINSLTETVDLAPTLCRLLDIDPLPGMHGEDLGPIIAGERTKEAIFAVGGHEDAMLARFGGDEPPMKNLTSGKQQTYRQCPDTMARTKAVRTATHKLVMRLRGGHELYDLTRDPDELDNRWGDPALADVTLDLQQRLIAFDLRTDPDAPYQVEFGA